MFGETASMGNQTVVLSVAQVAEIQDELYDVLEQVRSNPVLCAKVSNVIKRIESRPEQSTSFRLTPEMEEEHSQMYGLSKLIMQAQQQCQQ